MPIDWEEVAAREEAERTAPRPTRPGTFVAERPRPMKPAEMLPASPQVIDVSPAWQPMQSPGRDSTSAQDRAKAIHIRAIPVYAATVGIAVLVVILYSVTLAFFRVDVDVPLFADKIMVFLGVVFGWGLFVYLRLNQQEYDHTHAGVERLRIVEAADIQRQAMEHDAELKKMALATYIKMLEERKHE